MTPIETFSAAAGCSGRKVGSQLFFLCPTHPDKRPSLAVREATDGKLLVRCYAGCQTADVLEALELDFADLYPESAQPW